jgi:hypothetical protein
MTKQAFALLRKFYPSNGVYLKELSNFSTSKSSIEGRFSVPADAPYSIASIDYVTAEQYVRCFSQLSYALMYLLVIYEDGMTLYGSPAEFETLTLSGEMRCRRMDIHYRERNLKGADFSLSLGLDSIREAGRFVVVQLSGMGPIAVKAEFVAPLI